MTTITFHIKNRKKQVREFGNVLSDYYNYFDLFLHNEDEDGNMLPDDKWVLANCSGNPVLEGRDAIESNTGILDIDGDYYTIIVKNLDDLYEEEIEILRDYYLQDHFISAYCIDDVLQALGYNEISNIKVYKSNAEVFYNSGNPNTFGFFHIERDDVADMDEDEMTEYIKEIFEDNNISPLHMDKVEQIVNYWSL
jgi:hypothetical protein